MVGFRRAYSIYRELCRSIHICISSVENKNDIKWDYKVYTLDINVQANISLALYTVLEVKREWE